MSEPVLMTADLTKTFGGLVAVNNLDLAVARGEVRGLIGPNGSGKSTTLNVISGVYRASSGKVRLAGRDITALPADQRTRLGLARTFQNIRLFPHLSVLENVAVSCFGSTSSGLLQVLLATAGQRREEEETRCRAMHALEWVGLAGRADAVAVDLPYGLQRLVEIARALALQPQVLMLDEPAAGLNPTEKTELLALIRRMQREIGLTVLLVEHDMSLVMSVCDQITVLNFGARIAEGTPTVVQTNPHVIDAYLGTGYGLEVV